MNAASRLTCDGRTMRRMLAVVLAVAGAGILPSSAGAITVASGSVTMTSDAGDYIGQGQSYSYSTAAGDILSSTGSASVVEIGVNGYNGDWWTLDLAAPAGQALAVGTYAAATRYPFQGAGPGLSVYGNGRGCNTLTGSFTVTGVSFGPNDYLQSLDASFEQHCEGLEPALRGEVHVVDPPAPVALTLGLQLDPQGNASRVTGTATVSGTVTCSKPTSVYVSGTLTQRASRFAVASGYFSSQVACSASPTTWRATVSSGNGVPFNPGSAQLDATASAYDDAYGQQVTASRTATVKLTR
jgi:hypothetical protein